MPARAVVDRFRTPEEFYAERDSAPAGVRMELVDGELLVTPSPNKTHQRIVRDLSLLLVPYVREQRLGEILFAPFDVRLDRSVILQPDVLLIPSAEPDAEREARHVSLAIEVLSPSSARHDRVKKRPVYQRHRVLEYWIVDPDAEAVERWTPDAVRPEIIAERLEWDPAGAGQPFVLDLAEFFARLVPGA